MRKNCIRGVVVHAAESAEFRVLADRVSEFHASVIERRLRQADLTAEQKIAVIDRIIESLKSREVDGIIK